MIDLNKQVKKTEKENSKFGKKTKMNKFANINNLN